MVRQIRAQDRPEWALPERPNTPQIGDIWMESIDFIMENLPSVDGAVPGDWDGMGYKREDDHYPAVKESLTIQGWKFPLGMAIYPDGELEEFGDGHHRILAAQELGLTHVPVRAYAHSMDSVMSDSGSWSGDDMDMPDYDPATHIINEWGYR